MRPLLLLTLCTATLSLATPPDEVQEQANALLQKRLMTPLAEHAARVSRFSRARRPPQTRRLRLDERPSTDSHGDTFVTFAIDSRVGRATDDQPSWNKFVDGCVYVATGDIYVREADHYQRAERLLGKKVKPAPAHVCEPGAAPVAALPETTK